jgi:glycosyltransferase involved in cell wall biosynthesis
LASTQNPSRPLHVVLLNQAFHPDVVATAQMAKDLADELVKGGMKVTAIASRSIYGKSGASLPKYEVVKVEGGEIEIHRVGFSFFGRASTFLRILDFGFFYLLAALKLMMIRRPDVVVGFSTPPYIALLTILCRWLRGSRAVYWAMDLYPDVIIASGMIREGSPLTGVLSFMHRWLVRHADASVVLGRCMMDKVLAKAGDKARSRVKFIPVWSDEAGVRPIERGANGLRSTFNLGDAFTVMYSGNFGHGHDAATTMHAMTALKGRTSTGTDGVRFLFVGGGKRRKEIEGFIAKESIANAAYHDYQPREKLAESLSCGDVHLISLLEGMEGLIVPSKCFGIMAVARPAIFIGNPSSEIARVLVENDCGIVVRQGDGEGLTRAIEALAADPERARAMGERGRAAFMRHYSRTQACGAWNKLLVAVCGGTTDSFGGYEAAAAQPVATATGSGAVR